MTATAEVQQQNDITTDWKAWNDAGRPCVFWGKHPKLQSMQAYLRGVKSKRIRSYCTSEARKRYEGRISGMNPRKRQCLHDAIFHVMNEIESRGESEADAKRAEQLCIAMNLVADDLGHND